jgi:pilus assembly protein CpaE
VATGLTQMKEAPKVALVDMNLLFGEIPLFLEIKPNYHWGEITKDVSRLDPTFLMNILAKHGTGVYVLPSPAYLNGHPAATPQTMGHLLSLMRTMFDFIVVDGGQSLDSASLKILEVADAVFLVSILSLPCLSNTKRLLRSFGDLGYPSADRVRVVINRYLKKSEITLEDVEKGIGKKVFWTIPNDYGTTISAINQGKALVQCAAKAPITKNLSGLAQTLAVGESQKKKRWSLFKR